MEEKKQRNIAQRIIEAERSNFSFIGGFWEECMKGTEINSQFIAALKTNKCITELTLVRLTEKESWIVGKGIELNTRITRIFFQDCELPANFIFPNNRIKVIEFKDMKDKYLDRIANDIKKMTSLNQIILHSQKDVASMQVLLECITQSKIHEIVLKINSQEEVMLFVSYFKNCNQKIRVTFSSKVEKGGMETVISNLYQKPNLKFYAGNRRQYDVIHSLLDKYKNPSSERFNSRELNSSRDKNNKRKPLSEADRHWRPEPKQTDAAVIKKACLLSRSDFFDTANTKNEDNPSSKSANDSNATIKNL